MEAIPGINSTIEEISGIATTIAAAVEEQGSATADIARNVKQTAKATQEVSSHIGDVSQSANDTGGAAEQVLAEAVELSRKAGMFSGKVSQFDGTVRAAQPPVELHRGETRLSLRPVTTHPRVE